MKYDFIDVNNKDRQINFLEYKYYSTLRPICLGTYPKHKNNHLKSFTNYDRRVEVEPGIMAWGELIYPNPLTEDDIKEYELVKAK